MRNKLFSIVFFSFIALVFMSCSDNVVADFSFSPTVAKRGQSVTFTNLTTGNEDWTVEYWNWTFGDGYVSTLESPTHTYKEAGIYSIKLMVDSNKHYTKTLSISVYDSIPTILNNVDSVRYYKDVTFSALAYNPNAEDITYEWTFSDNVKGASLVDNTSTDDEVTVYFTQKNVYEIVKLHIEVGDSAYDVADTIFINDVKAKSVLMAQKNGTILRQRILDNGLEAYSSTGVSAGKHAFNLAALSNILYIFDAGTNVNYKSNWSTDNSGDGSINAYNMGTKTNTEIINNRGLSSHFGFFNGFADSQNIYWTDYSEFLYKTAKSSSLGTFDWKGSADAQTQAPFYLAKVDRVGYYGHGLASNQQSTGIYYYDEAYFWAKGGTGKGIYCFLATDILTANNTGTAPIPTLGAILTDYAIRAFKIDEINRKIYFSVTAPADKIGFWVSNISGSNATRIDDAPMDDQSLYITGIAIDNVSNKVYWAYRSPETVGAAAPSDGSWTKYYENNPTHKTGVKMTSLATIYKPAGTISYFAEDVVAYGIALDEVKK